MMMDQEDLNVQRLVVRALAAVIAFLVAGAVLAVSQSSESDDPVGDGLVPEGSVGPLPGTDVVAYVAERMAAVAAADGSRGAVVSLTAYRRDAEARDLAGGLVVEGLFVAAPGGEPSLVEDVSEWAEAARQDAVAERAELARILPTVDEPDFARQYEEDIARLDRLVRSIDPRAAVVFALAVRGDAAALRELAADPAVRLVDVSGGSRFSRANLRALRPEETVRAGEPRTRPV